MCRGRRSHRHRHSDCMARFVANTARLLGDAAAGRHCSSVCRSRYGDGHRNLWRWLVAFATGLLRG